MSSIPFETINWDVLPVTEHKGENGYAFWKTIQLKDIRIRMVEYTAGYKADHWCSKGHIIFCLEGEMTSELQDGTTHLLRNGMSYHVSDDASSHKSYSEYGVKLFIIDGDFLSK